MGLKAYRAADFPNRIAEERSQPTEEGKLLSSHSSWASTTAGTITAIAAPTSRTDSTGVRHGIPGSSILNGTNVLPRTQPFAVNSSIADVTCVETSTSTLHSEYTAASRNLSSTGQSVSHLPRRQGPVDPLAWTELLRFDNAAQKAEYRAREACMLNYTNFHLAFYQVLSARERLEQRAQARRIAQVRQRARNGGPSAEGITKAIERYNLRGDIDKMRPEQLDSDEGFWVLVGRASPVDTPLCFLMKYRQTQSYSAGAPSYGELSRWLGSRGIVARVVRLAGGRNLAEVAKSTLLTTWSDMSGQSLNTEQSLQLFKNLALNHSAPLSDSPHTLAIVEASCDYARRQHTA
jgi:hypothetical protein